MLHAIEPVGALIATTQFSYDSFNKIRSIRYPDQELVTCDYDHGGALRHVAGATPTGGVNEYVKDIRYDVFGHRVFQRLGNDVTTRYQYDPVMQRLQGVNTDSVNQGPLQRLTYSYTAVGNIAGVSTTPVAGALHLATISQGFFYDRLDQLVYAWGSGINRAQDSRYYSLGMTYDAIGNIANKSQSDWLAPLGGAWGNVARTTYTNAYQYNGLHPHRAVQVGARSITYDDNGNQVDLQGGGEPHRVMAWDEENNLRSVSDNGVSVQFRYDSSGTRTHRSSAQGVSQYASQWYSVRNGSLATKHIFAAGTRVASVIGALRVFFHPDH